MRVLFTIALAASTLAVAQPDRDARFESLLAQAREAQARSDFSSAAERYREALKISSGTPELWSNLGLVLYAAKQYDEASSALLKANQLGPGLYAPTLFLGLDLLELKRPADAISWLLKAHRMQPQDPQALVSLGRAYYVQRDHAKSQNWYRQATVTAPTDGHAWYGLGLAYLGLAEDASRTLAASHAQSGYAADLKAQALMTQGRLDEATHVYEKLFAGGDVPRCTHSDFAFLLAQRKQPEQARHEFEKDADSCPAARAAFDRRSDAGPRTAAGRNPNTSTLNVSALERLAGDSFFAGDLETTAEVSGALMRAHPNEPSGYYWAVRADQKLAVLALTRASEAEPDSVQMHALLGDLYQRQNNFPEAESEFNKVLRLSPGNVAGLIGLATAYLGDNKLDEAASAASAALNRNPQDPDINFVFGEILVAQHQYGEAEVHLKASLTVRSDLLPHVHALLGRVYSQTGRNREAIEELKQGLASDADGSVSYQLAR
ncbi:MAG TPA: tetratricopeptide repeat protein, partial [Verrucomicrobiae bacterium]|nr:tetratricopeptide repeat protein [Verrucomicrobiae bacterium]